MVLWKKIIGVILIVIGIFGLFLPGIQGIALIILGLILVGNHRLLNWFKTFINKFKK